MHIQQAHDLFSRRTNRSRFHVNISLDGQDAWPLAATAAASLSGQLDDCLTDYDLDAALDHFVQLHRAGIVGRDDLEAEIGRVMLALVDGEEEVATVSRCW